MPTNVENPNQDPKITSQRKTRVQVQVYGNDGLWNKVELLSVTSVDELLTYATRKLKMPWAARKVFLKRDGTRVKSDNELHHGMEVVISSGEEFKSKGKSNRARAAGAPRSATATRRA